LVDGVLVHERSYVRSAAGPGALTYQFVVDQPQLTQDGVVRVRFADVGADYDPSIADVWAAPAVAGLDGAGVAAPAHLTLTKSVDNTGGGAAAATAWTLSASGPTTISGHTGDAAITSAAVDAGTYTLAEAGGPTGYTPSAWSCTGGTLTGSSLVLAAGDTASCSITNTFIPPTPAHLTLAKTVDNTGGGAAAATAWTLSATGPTPISGHSGDPAITNAPVTAGTYTLAESGGPAPYSAGAWSCTGGALTGDSLVLVAGETASCSITNTFITGKSVDFTGSMEGALKFTPGAFVNAGFSFDVGTKQPAFVETVTSQLMIPVHCGSPNGPYAGVPITFKGNALDKNGVAFLGIVVPMGTINFNVPANSTAWIPTGDQNSILSWMTAIGSPDLCSGQTMYSSEGADFQATFSIPPVGHIFEQFHYRIPAAKGKPNTDCTNVTDPNRAKADVCGAGWSSTQDP
ncbi:MAG TPA: hypothetical protein VF302_12120, partial [Candidatus Limnocylindrales bacterium]